MIVGVDAGALSISDERLRVGVWRVTYNLLKELGKIDTKNSYKLYTFLPIEEGIRKAFGPRMENVVLSQRGFFKFWLPFELRRHPVDVFLGLSQSLPSFAKRSIGFIYDVGFLRYPKSYPGSFKVLKNQTEQLVKRANHIVAISASTASDIEKEYHFSAKDITVSYPGVDDRFTQKGKTYKGKHPYFLFVGALKRGKNIPFAIRAYSQILKNLRIDYDFLIIGGDYWVDPEIKATIKKLNLTKRVKLLGFVPDKDLPKYYRGATALVMPSLWEGFCLPVVEAMASGCPVIASTHGSLPEIVGNAGVTIDPTNEIDLAKVLKEISESKEKRNQMSQTGLQRAKNFSWDTFGKKVLGIISEVKNEAD